MNPKPLAVFLVHGEPEARQTIASLTRETLDIPVLMPDLDETYDLSGDSGLPALASQR